MANQLNLSNMMNETKRVLDNQAKIKGYKDVEDYANSDEYRNSLKEQAKEALNDLIIRADQLDQVKQPNPNTNFKRVSIFNHKVALNILERNCFKGLTLPFSEIGLDFGSLEQEELIEVFEQAGYKVSIQKNGGYGHYFEILKG